MSGLRVAFQGERGAYSEEAVTQLFGEIEVQPHATLRDVFEAVTVGRADRAVVPAENSHAGSINETYDLLLAHALFITGELDLRIRHCLLALPGQELRAIRQVYSHPQALAQCETFLRQYRMDPVLAYDTAGSAKLVAERRLTGAAAIAGRAAAHIYGLAILAEGIETNPANYTKFLSLAREPAPRVSGGKTSIVFTTQNVPGALYHALGAFATRAINLTKLESRPRRQIPWEYLFYVDFEGHQDDAQAAAALADLSRITTFLRVLGSYPRSPTPLT
jgi:prephenate dehydratase